MGIMIADGVELLDVTFVGGAPIGVARLDLAAGLTVLYGANGSGKTTVLDGVGSALTGVRRTAGEARLRCRLIAPWTYYDPSLLVSLARSARAVAAQLGSAPADPYWEDAVYAFEGDAWFLVTSEQDANHDVVIAQLQTDLAELGRSGMPASDYEFTLVAVGSAAEPAWDFYVSTIMEPTEAKPIDNELLRVDEHFVPAAVDLLTVYPRSGFDVWTPRVKFIARVSAAGAVKCLSPNSGFDIHSATAEYLLDEHWEPFDSEDPDPLLEYADDTTVTLGDTIVRLVDEISGDATAVVRRLLGGAITLHYDIHHPKLWPTRGLGQWSVTEPGGVILPVESQGSALRRWSSLAIEISLRRGRYYAPNVLVVDEPENALHPAALTRLAAGFTFDEVDARSALLAIGQIDITGMIVATHSPVLMSTTNATAVHVTRDTNSLVTLEPIDTGNLDALATSLGLTRGDVLSTVRTFVLVEGEHDLAVLNTVFGGELAEQRAQLVPMRGAKQAASMLNVDMISRYSDAQLVFVIDGLGTAASDAWDSAIDAANAGDHNSASRHLHRIERPAGGGGEAGWLVEAGLTALARGQLDRTRLVGLERRDILEYLPVHDYVPHATTWQQLRTEHQKSPDPKDFKEWLRRRHKAIINPQRMAISAEGLDDLADLPRILDTIANR